ncbi:MAG: ribbon-helix-helix protein, CopG family [Myxococcales bacterium]|nr:ribbon-helix-helix protein, CopG family [Myxococcales bacterium]
MIRTQIQLEDEQLEQLKRRAESEGTSLAEAVRRAIALFLRGGSTVSRGERKRMALEAAGRFGSGKKDASTQHDAYLAEAFRG